VRGIKFHVCYALFIPAEKEPSFMCKRVKESKTGEEKKQIGLVSDSDARMLSL
jgi:hypothetical protein